MTKKIELKAITRKNEEKNSKEIRRAGLIPAVVYGFGIDNISLKLKKVELEKAFEKAGESSLIDLQLDEKPAFKVIIKDVQFNPLKGTIEHVDFYQVDMNKPIEVELPFVFVNEARAEKEQGAMIMRTMESVNVKCLPGELLENIEIDLSKLIVIGDMIRVENLTLPKSFEVLSDGSEAIVSAVEHKQEEELPAPVVATPEEPAKDGKKEVAPKADAKK